MYTTVTEMIEELHEDEKASPVEARRREEFFFGMTVLSVYIRQSLTVLHTCKTVTDCLVCG